MQAENLREQRGKALLLGVEVSHQTVYNWINKYVTLMKEYVEKITPNVGDTWRADELWVKMLQNLEGFEAIILNCVNLDNRLS